MSETNEKERTQTGRKRYVIAIVAVLLVVLVAGATILIHSLAKKDSGNSRKDSESSKPSENAIWRVSEIAYLSNESPCVYRLSYDSKGREIRESVEETTDSEKMITKTTEFVYYSEMCGIRRETADGYTEEYFFADEPLIYYSSRKFEPIDSFMVGDSGRLTKVINREYDHGINTWLFDEEGRPIRLSHNDSDERRRYADVYQYDDLGRLIRITMKYNTDEVSYIDSEIVYDGDKRIVRNLVEGTIRYEEEYVGQRKIRETRYDSEGNVSKEEKYYYPNGNFPGEQCAFESIWNVEEQTWEKEVELAPDGQPLREMRANDHSSMECRYDENGMLSELTEKDAEGQILNAYRFEFDENGNLTRYSTKDGRDERRYTWIDVSGDSE